MLEIAVLLVSTVLHVVSCIICYKHLKEFNGGWGLLMASFSTMVARRLIVIYGFVYNSHPVNMESESFALLASILLLWGLLRVGHKQHDAAVKIHDQQDIIHIQQDDIERLKRVSAEARKRTGSYR